MQDSDAMPNVIIHIHETASVSRLESEDQEESVRPPVICQNSEEL